MPPPSPSQQPPPLASYGSLPPPKSFSRELPGLGTVPRSGSGMSISSLLDSNAPSQPPRHQPTPQVPPSTGTIRALTPPSRRSHSGSAGEHGQWRRPETPERNAGPPRMSEAPPYSTAPSPRYYSAAPRDSPEYGRNPPPQYQPTPPRPAHLYHASPPNTQAGAPDERNPPPRPSSQPPQYALPPRQPEYHDSQSGPRLPGFGPSVMQRNVSQDGPPMHHSPPHAERQPMPPIRDRPATAQPPPLAPYQSGPPAEESNLLRRNLLGDQARDDSRREYTPKKEEYSVQSRQGYRGPYYGAAPTSVPVSEAPRSHPQMFEPGRPRIEQFPPEAPVYNRPPFEPERRREESAPVVAPPADSRRQSGEGMARSSSFLGISSDPNKRGRASPLPQAVKGAQAQYVLPGSDPSVKLEFGRLFSGVGGTGSITPSRQSPVPQRTRDDDENEGAQMIRTGSKGFRLGRRQREDDGRQTPVGSGHRAGKRRQRLDDDDSPIVNRNLHSGTPIHQLSRSAAVVQPHMPFKVNSAEVMEFVADLPRRHLGFGVYALKYGPPAFADKYRADYHTRPTAQFVPPRRFSPADYNCTYTFRVGKQYLTHNSREILCSERYLFGTEVHTDDSDPLLAAMHAGYIKGAWGPDVDVSLIGLHPTPPASPNLRLLNQEYTSPPKEPMSPPPGLDLHITVLILPQLKDYALRYKFGIKSAHWGKGHDGESFMVHSIKWVNDGKKLLDPEPS